MTTHFKRYDLEKKLTWPTATIKGTWKRRDGVHAVELTLETAGHRYFKVVAKVFDLVQPDKYVAYSTRVHFDKFTKKWGQQYFSKIGETSRDKTKTDPFKAKLLEIFVAWWDSDISGWLRKVVERNDLLLDRADELDNIEQFSSTLASCRAELKKIEAQLYADTVPSRDFEIVIRVTKHATDTTALEGDVAYLIEDCVAAYRKQVSFGPDADDQWPVESKTLDDWTARFEDRHDTKATITLKRINNFD